MNLNTPDCLISLQFYNIARWLDADMSKWLLNKYQLLSWRSSTTSRWSQFVTDRSSWWLHCLLIRTLAFISPFILHPWFRFFHRWYQFWLLLLYWSLNLLWFFSKFGYQQVIIVLFIRWMRLSNIQFWNYLWNLISLNFIVW